MKRVFEETINRAVAHELRRELGSSEGKSRASYFQLVQKLNEINEVFKKI